jgi:hypothetical protein
MRLWAPASIDKQLLGREFRGDGETLALHADVEQLLQGTDVLKRT